MSDLKATIAEHWALPVDAVTVTIAEAHGGWVARVAIRQPHWTTRWSETGLTRESAVGKLIEASAIRAAMARELADGIAPLAVGSEAP